MEVALAALSVLKEPVRVSPPKTRWPPWLAHRKTRSQTRCHAKHLYRSRLPRKIWVEVRQIWQVFAVRSRKPLRLRRRKASLQQKLPLSQSKIQIPSWLRKFKGIKCLIIHLIFPLQFVIVHQVRFAFRTKIISCIDVPLHRKFLTLRTRLRKIFKEKWRRSSQRLSTRISIKSQL